MKILDLSGQTTILRAGFLLVYALGHLHLGVPFKQVLMIRDHDLSKYPKMVFPVKHGAYRSHYDVIDSPIFFACTRRFCDDQSIYKVCSHITFF